MVCAFFRTCEREYMNVHYTNVQNLFCALPHTMNVQCTFTTTPRWLHTTLNTNIFVCVVCCGGFPYTHTITDHFFPLIPTYPRVLYELKISYLLINYTLT